MSGWGVLALVLAVWAAYKLGRSRSAMAQYARGYIEGYNAGFGDDAHVGAQRENAPWQ